MKFILIFLLTTLSIYGQSPNLKELTYDEYLGYVKKYHPMVKSANLEISKSQANLMMARGAFDPKLEVDYNNKQFAGKSYYSLLNSSFKIPTWYGIEVKASFNNSEGMYVNPENTLPNQGLTSLGVTVPLGQGLLINQRMSDLKKAKIQIQLSQSERKLQAILVLYDASVAYFNWKKSYSEVKLYEEYLKNAQKRYTGIANLIENGDKSAIDSVEAKITVNNRLLNLEDARLKLAKSKLELANYLWLENNLPLELQDNIIPEENLENNLVEVLKTNRLLIENISIENHPKINALQNKIELLEVDRKLKANSLLPKMDVGYHYLSEPSSWDQTNFNNHKIAVNFSFPLFLRKERGSLQLSKFKIQDGHYNLNIEKTQLTNKIKAQQTEIKSLEKQKQILNNLVSNYALMLQSEERLFSFGESSMFLINSRENNLVSAQLSKIALDTRYMVSNAELFKIMGNPE